MINNSLGSFSCILWMSFILILMFAGCNTNYSWNSNTPRINVASICTFSYDRKLSDNRTCFGGTYTKIGTIQRRLAWPPGRKDDTQIREAFHVFFLRRCCWFLLQENILFHDDFSALESRRQENKWLLTQWSHSPTTPCTIKKNRICLFIENKPVRIN